MRDDAISRKSLIERLEYYISHCRESSKYAYEVAKREVEQAPGLRLVPLTYKEAHEILNRGDPVFCEERGGQFLKSSWYVPVGENCHLLYEEDYGVTWRCWAYRPTDEESKAAEWLPFRVSEEEQA